jgi:hypothetical protein
MPLSCFTLSVYNIQAMIIAHERSSDYGNLLGNVKGIVFMGTPHRGSSVASWVNIFSRVLNAAQLGSATNSALLNVLEMRSETLLNISQQFVERGAMFQIRTFYETEKLDFMNCLVCPTASCQILNSRLILSRLWTKIRLA